MDGAFSQNSFGLQEPHLSMSGAMPCTPNVMRGMKSNFTGLSGSNNFYITQLENENEQLKAENRDLKVWKEAYDKLVAAIPTLVSTTGAVTSSTLISPLTALDQKDYPNVRFWYKADYYHFLKDRSGVTAEVTTDSKNKPKGSSRASQGENVKLTYIEKSDGTIIDGFEATAIRTAGHALFFKFKREGTDPLKWSQAGSDVKNTWNNEMCRRFPPLQLCAANWKAQQVATYLFPGWVQKHSSQKGNIKQEPTSDDNDSDVDINPQSRKRALATNDTSEKKTKKKARQSEFNFDDVTNTPLTVNEFYSNFHVVIKETIIQIINPLFGAKAPKAPSNEDGSAVKENTQSNLGNPVTATSSAIDTADNATKAIQGFTTGKTLNISSVATSMISTTGVTTVSENVSKALTGWDTKDAAEHSGPSAPITVPQGSIPSSDLVKRLSSPCQIIGDIGEAIDPNFSLFVGAVDSGSGSSARAPETTRLQTETATVQTATDDTDGPKDIVSSLTIAVVPNESGSTSGTETALSCSSVAVSAALIPGPKAKGRGTATMQPSASKTARNLCAIEWCKKNPKGTTGQFGEYWDKIKSTEIGEAYKTREKRAAEALHQAAEASCT